MNLSEIAFKYRPVVLLITLTLMVFGGVSYFSLPAQEDPSITIRESFVTTHYPGLPAERIELLITKPIEEAVLTVTGIDEIRSTSYDGTSIVYVKAFDAMPPSQLAQTWDEVEEAVMDAKSRLPENASTPSVNDNFGDVAVITLALTGKDYTMAELFDFAQYSRDRLNTIEGTRKVDILGARQERIYIEAENAILGKAGISPSLIVQALRNQNIISPSGVIDTGDKAFSMLTTGDFKSVQDVENLLLRLPSDNSIFRLGDLVRVTHGYADPAPRSAYFNGQDAIVLSIVMQPSQSVINYSKVAKEVINEIQRELPVGLELSVITWQAEQVENAVYGVSESVIQTLAIVLAVVMLFLGVRTGMIVGSIVPAVVLATLAIMSFTGMALERMSLATIVIALGLLVDNGVVIAEDFKRRLFSDHDRLKALKDTGKELAIPLLSSSLTTILVFTPLMLAQHSAGEYTRNISLVILITLTASWILAMTVTPTLCYLFIKDPSKDPESAKKEKSDIFSRIEGDYQRVLYKVLNYRKSFVFAMFLLLPVGGMLMGSAPQKFFPDSDRAQVLVYVNLPTGVTTRTTQERVKTMMEIVQDKKKFPELGSVVAYVGFGGPRFVLSLAPTDPASNVGFLVINAKDKQAVDEAIPRLRSVFRSQLTDVEARVTGMFLGPSDPNVIQIQVKGPDAAYIQEQSKKIEQLLREVPGTIDVWSNWFNPITRLDIQVDQKRALAANVTSKDVSDMLATYVTGKPISEFRDFDDVYPIVARAVSAERTNLSRLESLTIFPTGSPEGVPLGQVAEVVPVVGYPAIQREDLVRTVTIEARNLRVSPEDMAPMLQSKIDALNKEMKAGHLVEFDGIVKDSITGKKALFAGFPLCLALIVVLLVAQFNGYKRPFIVMLTIPLVLIGVGLGLQIMRAEFGFLVILGFFALAGIIVNNGIVLIDRIDIELKQGDKEPIDAIVSACARRLRPIFITTITTIVGLLPLILGKDVLFYGMASIMAFGLAIGTILTLGVVPAIYCMLFNIESPKSKAIQRS